MLVSLLESSFMIVCFIFQDARAIYHCADVTAAFSWNKLSLRQFDHKAKA